MPCFSPGAKIAESPLYSWGEDSWSLLLKWLLCFMSRVLGEDGSCWLPRLPSSRLESLSHEQAEARTNMYQCIGPCILSLSCHRMSERWMEEGSPLPFGSMYLEFSLCKAALGRIRNACTLVLLGRYYSFWCGWTWGEIKPHGLGHIWPKWSFCHADLG